MDILLVPLSYLEYYHAESLNNSHYTTQLKLQKQQEVLKTLRKKGGIGEDCEVAIKQKDLTYFTLQ